MNRNRVMCGASNERFAAELNLGDVPATHLADGASFDAADPAMVRF